VNWKDAPIYLLYSDQNHYEPWDFDSPENPGIGGSETNQIEWAKRLARRGWDVTSFSPTAWDGVREWQGVKWTNRKNADCSRKGIWLLYRDPALADNFPRNHPDQKIIVVAQDTHYANMTPERAAMLDAYICLCQAHAQYTLSAYPYLAGKVWINSNGVKSDQIREIAKEGIVRNPHKIVFASSPDRGLVNLLSIFRRAREWVASLELHIFYGFDNIDKSLAALPANSPWRILKDTVLREAQQPGVFLRGRIGQTELARERFSAGMAVHSTLFTETSMISVMEEQACGAIPICTPVWAAAENTMHGSFVIGDPAHDMIQKKFVGEIYRWASQPELQEDTRKVMMPQARSRFNWERTVDLLEAQILNFHEFSPRNVSCQYNFALKYAEGKILNVGSCDDAANLKAKGAINMDIHAVDPALNRDNVVDVVADARDLPAPFREGEFDSLTVTEMLEHYRTEDVPEQLIKFKRCVKPGGKIIFTVPDDHRELQGRAENGHTQYADGIGFKHQPVGDDTIQNWTKQAGLKILVHQPIEYSWGEEDGGVQGHGVVCVAEEV
jgi:glycosyltransferase involved in cell wall biosynthesis